MYDQIRSGQSSPLYHDGEFVTLYRGKIYYNELTLQVTEIKPTTIRLERAMVIQSLRVESMPYCTKIQGGKLRYTGYVYRLLGHSWRVPEALLIPLPDAIDRRLEARQVGRDLRNYSGRNRTDT